MLKDKAGQIGNLTSNAISFGVLIIIVAVVATVVTNVRNTQTVNSSAYNIGSSGMTGLENVSGQFGLMGTIIVFSIVIGLVIAGFVVFGRR